MEEPRFVRGSSFAKRLTDTRRHPDPAVPVQAVLLTPAVRMISAVPTPSAASTTIRPRATLLLGTVPVRQDRAEMATVGEGTPMLRIILSLVIGLLATIAVAQDAKLMSRPFASLRKHSH
jgi:hypothetical protein